MDPQDNGFGIFPNVDLSDINNGLAAQSIDTEEYRDDDVEVEPAELLQTTGEMSRLRRRGALRADRERFAVTAEELSGSRTGGDPWAQWMPFSETINQTAWFRSTSHGVQTDPNHDDEFFETMADAWENYPPAWRNDVIRRRPSARAPLSQIFLDSGHDNTGDQRYRYTLYCGSSLLEHKGDEEQEIWEDSDPERWKKRWTPSPLSTVTLVELPKRGLPSAQDGCGAIIHNASSPTVRRGEWIAGSSGASELLIPVGTRYCSENITSKIQKFRCRRRIGQNDRVCHCRCEAVACANW